MKKWMEFFAAMIAANALLIFVAGIINILFELDLSVEDIALPYDFWELAMMSLALLLVGGLFWLLANISGLFKRMGKHPVRSVAIAAIVTAGLIISGNFGLTMAMGGPLQRAVEMGNTKALTMLLESNTYDATDLNEPLYFSLQKANYDMAEALISSGAEVNSIGNGEFESPLLVSSVFHFEKEAISFLLDHGANANAKDNLGRTALIVAVTYRGNNFSEADTLSVLELLHKAGADAAIAAKDGKTALDIATDNQKQPILDYFTQISH